MLRRFLSRWSAAPVASTPVVTPVVREGTELIVTLNDGLRVVVADSLENLSSYVFREQLDWFEQELGFLRSFVRPGMRIVDIGASHGAYALPLSKIVGDEGRVWAFEPASEVRGFLQRSIALNDIETITVVAAAVADAPGNGVLEGIDQSELARLASEPAAAGRTESVDLVTLNDYFAGPTSWGIDVLKLDAEGAEARILRGADRFLEREAPLILFEHIHGSEVDQALVNAFADLGYPVFRFAPGLNLLIPFDSTEAELDRPLNLFACAAHRARQLERDGFLVSTHSFVPRPGSDWRDGLRGRPFADRLLRGWRAAPGDRSARDALESALIAYSQASDTEVSPGERVGALRAAQRSMATLCRREPTPSRLSTHCRIASELGWRGTARAALQQAMQMSLDADSLDWPEPFLPADQRFDAVDPGDRMADWWTAMLVETFERLRAFSSFFTGAKSREVLSSLCATGFSSADMERRLGMVTERFANR